VIGQIVRVKEEQVVFVVLPDNRIVRVPRDLVAECRQGSLNLNQIVHLNVDEDDLEEYVFYDSSKRQRPTR